MSVVQIDESRDGEDDRVVAEKMVIERVVPGVQKPGDRDAGARGSRGFEVGHKLLGHPPELFRLFELVLIVREEAVPKEKTVVSRCGRSGERDRFDLTALLTTTCTNRGALVPSPSNPPHEPSATPESPLDSLRSPLVAANRSRQTLSPAPWRDTAGERAWRGSNDSP